MERFQPIYIIFLIRYILNTKVIFSGIENLKKNEKFFVASAHQSLFETFILQAPLNTLFLFLKKELLKIPIIWLVFKKIDSIEIVRETTTKENLNFFDNIKITN